MDKDDASLASGAATFEWKIDFPIFFILVLFLNNVVVIKKKSNFQFEKKNNDKVIKKCLM